MYFFTSLPVFFKLVTLTKHRILQVRSHFFIFLFLFFSWKNVKKRVQNWMPKNHWRNSPNWESKTDKKWRGKPCKSRKIAKKRCFWKGGFLMIFWVAKKSKKGGMPIIGGWVLLAPGLQWGTIGGTINQYNSLSNTPMGQWPGELLLLLLLLLLL